MSTVRAFIALGGNLPFEGLDSRGVLARAVEALEEAGLEVLARSGLWVSPAWPPGVDQPDYINAVVEVGGVSDPPGLYELLLGVERRFGRDRRERWAARTLDLDILAIEGAVGRFGDLELPHARMHERAFVLAPLAEIAPDWRHPLLGLRVDELLLGVSGAARRLGELG
ncbi:MAG: 2-amino-4-hydroxy-6-hydroxymethyldihydropteridine diphosphokinase [Hyphomonadaceae bacterium]|nr:2-amino-4-hydroxy-6-hydroxymethyldihydropteridine diphosphokinase [Hyphomonadaceae bacterium]